MMQQEEDEEETKDLSPMGRVVNDCDFNISPSKLTRAQE